MEIDTSYSGTAIAAGKVTAGKDFSNVTPFESALVDESGTETDETTSQAEEDRIKRESFLNYLRVYQETYGSPKEKELRDQPVPEDEEDDAVDDEERNRRKAKDAIVYEDPEEPGKVCVAAVMRDETGDPIITRTHSIDTGGGGQDEDKSGRAASKEAESDGGGEVEKDVMS